MEKFDSGLAIDQAMLEFTPPAEVIRPHGRNVDMQRKTNGVLVAVFLCSLCVSTAYANVSLTPQRWDTYALQGSHNAYYPSGFPARSWTFVVPGARNINRKIVRSPITIRDLVGFPIGVSVVGGVVYAPNDNGYLYALNAKDGHLRWAANAYGQIMTTPLVETVKSQKLAYIGVGNSVFAYSQAKRFGIPGAHVVRGTDVSAIEAIDTNDGMLRWVYPTKGEDMPTPVFVNGKIIFGNGDGHVYALGAENGTLLWKTSIDSFVSMSSATPADGGQIVVLGGTHPSAIYGISSVSGKILWKVYPRGIYSSSGGDGTWAAQGNVVVGQIEIHRAAQAKGMSSSEEIALNARSGHVLWSKVLGSGKVPPRNKDAVPTVVDGTIFTGSPVTHDEYAMALESGRILWKVHLSAGMKAAPLVLKDRVIQPTGNGDLYALDKQTGAVENIYRNRCGGFGPQNGVVIGSTYFIGSNAGCVEAIPTSEILDRHRG